MAVIETKVAYLIVAHTDSAQVNRLVKALSYKSRVFIHLDKKIELKNFKIDPLPDYACFIQNRVRVTWGGFKMVQAIINLMEAALNCGETFSHLVVLSGLDYPIKPVEKIYDFLCKNSEHQFIRYYRMTEVLNQIGFRQERYRFKDAFLPPSLHQIDALIRKGLEVSLKPIKRKFFNNLTPAWGSCWFALTPDLCRYILDFIDSNPDVFRFYKTTYSPEELLFHTIVANSPYANDFEEYKGVELLHDRYVINPLCHIGNLHIINPDISRILTAEDWSLVEQSDKFFARKFFTEKSLSLLNKIDSKLLY